MLREIVLDTETTGLDPALGHRIVEIGAVELVNHIPSGRYFHKYVNPERDVPVDAFTVHGLSAEFLSAHPTFAAIADELESFLATDRLVIHNAGFDIGFLEWELKALGRRPFARSRIVDTLLLARQKHPMAPNSLDALCKRYAIDNSRRDKHGALLDAELLAEIYLELIGGRQASFALARIGTGRPLLGPADGVRALRPRPLLPRLSESEIAAHGAMVATLGQQALWLNWLRPVAADGAAAHASG